jgi:hypothetical protein
MENTYTNGHDKNAGNGGGGKPPLNGSAAATPEPRRRKTNEPKPETASESGSGIWIPQLPNPDAYLRWGSEMARQLRKAVSDLVLAIEQQDFATGQIRELSRLHRYQNICSLHSESLFDEARMARQSAERSGVDACERIVRVATALFHSARHLRGFTLSKTQHLPRLRALAEQVEVLAGPGFTRADDELPQLQEDADRLIAGVMRLLVILDTEMRKTTSGLRAARKVTRKLGIRESFKLFSRRGRQTSARCEAEGWRLRQII